MAKKIYNKLIKGIAIAIATPGYAVSTTTKVIVYGITENETARAIVDLFEIGGMLNMVGAMNIGKEI